VLHVLAGTSRPTLRIGSTEHAAAQLLPALAAALEEGAGGHDVRFRVDRGSRLRQAVAGGSLDVALLLGSTGPGRRRVGDLGLTWYSAPGWRRPTDRPLPVVAFDKPCALRTRALDTLAAHAVPATVSSEATQLAGVHAAVAAGLGVALMATLGDTPPGLVARDDLPAPDPLQLVACPRAGLPAGITERVVDALRPVLAAAAPAAARSFA
jgi:DNA-binding transcriptional LysR family regulator